MILFQIIVVALNNLQAQAQSCVFQGLQERGIQDGTYLCA